MPKRTRSNNNSRKAKIARVNSSSLLKRTLSNNAVSSRPALLLKNLPNAAIAGVARQLDNENMIRFGAASKRIRNIAMYEHTKRKEADYVAWTSAWRKRLALLNECHRRLVDEFERRKRQRFTITRQFVPVTNQELTTFYQPMGDAFGAVYGLTEDENGNPKPFEHSILIPDKEEFPFEIRLVFNHGVGGLPAREQQQKRHLREIFWCSSVQIIAAVFEIVVDFTPEVPIPYPFEKWTKMSNVMLRMRNHKEIMQVSANISDNRLRNPTSAADLKLFLLYKYAIRGETQWSRKNHGVDIFRVIDNASGWSALGPSGAYEVFKRVFNAQFANQLRTKIVEDMARCVEEVRRIINLKNVSYEFFRCGFLEIAKVLHDHAAEGEPEILTDADTIALKRRRNGFTSTITYTVDGSLYYNKPQPRGSWKLTPRPIHPLSRAFKVNK